LTQQQARLASGQSFDDIKEREERELSAPDGGLWPASDGDPVEEGQSGNAGAKKGRPTAVATVEIIDRLFVKPVQIVENGVAR